jgi:hypothetical protein
MLWGCWKAVENTVGLLNNCWKSFGSVEQLLNTCWGFWKGWKSGWKHNF